MQDREQNVIWAPQPGFQEAFMACPLYEVLAAGNRGGGKTCVLLMDYAQDVGRGWGSAWQGVIFRQSFPQLRNVISESKRWFYAIWKKGSEVNYNAGENFWEWSTGERLYFRQFKNADDYYDYHGFQLPWIGWEELTTWADDVGYKRMMSTSRSTVPGMPRKIRSTTNPYGPGMGWVKLRFGLPENFGEVIDDDIDEETGRASPPRVAIESLLIENRALLEADPDYQDKIAQAARNEEEKRAWLYNDWNVAAGSMFSDVWSNDYNVLDPFPIPRTWRVDRAFDWGSSKPFSVSWWAESDGSDVRLADGRLVSTVRGDLFRIHEWYGWTGKPNEGLRMLAKDVARGIREREDVNLLLKPLRIKIGPADSSIFNVENGHSVAHDMAASIRFPDGRSVKGVRWRKADKSPGSRKIGWEVMRKRMRAARPPGEGLPREEPGLFVFSTCKQFLRTVPILPRDEKDPDDVDTNAEDHIADEARYRVRMTGRRGGNGRRRGGVY